MTPSDKILIAVLTFGSILSYSIVTYFFPPSANASAIVEIKNKEVRRFSLDPNIEQRKISVEIEGGEALFHIADGKIRIMSMPDKICSKHICSKKGWIEKPWDMIVCLPNKLVVRIEGEKDNGGIDLISR